VDREWDWKIWWLVFPRLEWRSIIVAGWPENHAKRAGVPGTINPAIPELRSARRLAPRFALITHPEQFEIGIPEKEATTGRPLTRMRVWRALSKSQLSKARPFWSVN